MPILTTAHYLDENDTMLIIQIAIGVVFGVLFLRFIPVILIVSISISVVALLAFLAVLAWSNLQVVIIGIGAVGGAIVMFGMPFLLKNLLVSRSQRFAVIVAGNSPYDTLAMQPIRVLIMIFFVMSVAMIELGMLISGAYIVSRLTS
jgi:hypothetical protein